MKKTFELDPSRLLGFRLNATTAARSAKVGLKAGVKIGAKLGGKAV